MSDRTTIPPPPVDLLDQLAARGIKLQLPRWLVFVVALRAAADVFEIVFRLWRMSGHGASQ